MRVCYLPEHKLRLSHHLFQSKSASVKSNLDGMYRKLDLIEKSFMKDEKDSERHTYNQEQLATKKEGWG